MRSTNFLIGAFLACGLSLFAPAFISAAPLSELLPRKGVGIDGMGFASIILAVIDYLKGSNAYVSLNTHRGQTTLESGNTPANDLSALGPRCPRQMCH